MTSSDRETISNAAPMNPLEMHERWNGKLSIVAKSRVGGPADLAWLYTPGVAQPCRKIAENVDDVYRYTGKGNLVAVVSDGSAVLGLGNIGPEAGLPVMEGKSLLFKEFAGIDSVPIVLGTQNADEIVRTVELMAPSFGGINLEDIAAPRCFEVETQLQSRLSIPVFHDDQHGTAIVVLAGLLNASKIVGRALSDLSIVVNGAGSAGTAIANILLGQGVRNLLVCDRQGILSPNDSSLNAAMAELARRTNPGCRTGSLADALNGAEAFVGVSAPGVVTPAMVRSMAPNAIVFAMANPDPEIYPAEALAAGAKIVATGRSDFPNQINNVLAFPGIFRGALDVRARRIDQAMKLAAARAISELVDSADLAKGTVIPSPFHPGLTFDVALATAESAISSGVARIHLEKSELIRRIQVSLKAAGAYQVNPSAG